MAMQLLAYLALEEVLILVAGGNHLEAPMEMQAELMAAAALAGLALLALALLALLFLNTKVQT